MFYSFKGSLSIFTLEIATMQDIWILLLKPCLFICPMTHWYVSLLNIAPICTSRLNHSWVFYLCVLFLVSCVKNQNFPQSAYFWTWAKWSIPSFSHLLESTWLFFLLETVSQLCFSIYFLWGQLLYPWTLCTSDIYIGM